MIADYKFYVSFENTVQEGYVSEKLFVPMLFGAVPLYLGAPNVPPVTLKKSFIHVFDFRSVSELADYLVYLDSNDTAFEEYFEWHRDSYRAFTDEFLKWSVKQVALQSAETNNAYEARTARCCRLCDREWLLAQRHEKRTFVEPYWPEEKVLEAFSMD